MKSTYRLTVFVSTDLFLIHSYHKLNYRAFFEPKNFFFSLLGAKNSKKFLFWYSQR